MSDTIEFAFSGESDDLSCLTGDAVPGCYPYDEASFLLNRVIRFTLPGGAQVDLRARYSGTWSFGVVMPRGPGDDGADSPDLSAVARRSEVCSCPTEFVMTCPAGTTFEMLESSGR